MMGKDFKELSPLELIHNPANGLYDFGSIDGKTMRQYDDDIKRVWLKNKVSQTLFAKLPK